jgi:hypothetical protein
MQEHQRNPLRESILFEMIVNVSFSSLYVTIVNDLLAAVYNNALSLHGLLYMKISAGSYRAVNNLVLFI